jgi:TRAP-type C4-dicarboxylate transport system permease small subunit
VKERQNFWLKRAELWGRRLENILLSFLVIGLISLASIQIIMRNILSMGYPWTDSVVRLMVLWLALSGGVAASRDQKQIAIDIVTRALPSNMKRVADVIAHLFTVLVTGLLAWHSLRFVQDSYAFGDTLMTNWPAWVFQIILPFGFALICYRYFLRALREIMRVEP